MGSKDKGSTGSLDRFLERGNQPTFNNEEGLRSTKRKAEDEQHAERLDQNMLLKEILEEMKWIRRENKETNKKLDELTGKMDEEREKKERELASLRAEMEELREQIADCKRREERREKHERRLNIIVRGIKEEEQENNNGTKEKISKIINEQLGLGNVRVECAERLGRKSGDRIRLVKAKLANELEKNEIMKNKFKLKNTPIFVGDDLTYEQREGRRHLREKMAEARAKGETAYMRGDVLTIHRENRMIKYRFEAGREYKKVEEGNMSKNWETTTGGQEGYHGQT